MTLPDAWQATAADDSAAVVAEESPAAEEQAAAEEPTGVAGWPAPPPDALRDAPAQAAEPGPDTIDWGTSAPSSGPDEASEVEEPPPASGGASLDDIWNRPAAPVASEPDRAAVDRHEHATATPAEQPVAPRLANAPVPEGDDFYGPRRRRWFKRRR